MANKKFWEIFWNNFIWYVFNFIALIGLMYIFPKAAGLTQNPWLQIAIIIALTLSLIRVIWFFEPLVRKIIEMYFDRFPPHAKAASSSNKVS